MLSGPYGRYACSSSTTVGIAMGDGMLVLSIPPVGGADEIVLRGETAVVDGLGRVKSGLVMIKDSFLVPTPPICCS